mmetsp:Transcript_24692/g.68182  ORF Transcript_24692/g.68182 Transcript_24692/m.68182 type:complete len:390 (-) Transcript_24692:1758-2927(-)
MCNAPSTKNRLYRKLEIENSEAIPMSVETGDKRAVVLSVQIPEGAEHGDSLSFEANGQTFTIEIPPGSVAGEILQIKLGSSVNENDTEMGDPDVDCKDKIDGEKITVEMVTGSKISVLQTTVGDVSDRNVSDGTHQLVWPASRYVVHYINTPKFRRQVQGVKINSVLELGAGHGLFGLAFADVIASFKKSGEGVHLLLTDVERALPQLEANVAMNQEIFNERVHISTLPLKWHNFPMPKTTCQVDFILGSDLLYNCSVIPSLVCTIRRLLSKSTKILISVRWRKPSEERCFFTMLSDIVDWKLVHGTCSLDYRLYGNGSCESDKYFSQTMVGIQGKVVTLSSIDERLTEEMTTEEFEQFEELQTQVYLGEVVERSRNTDHIQKRQKLKS